MSDDHINAMDDSRESSIIDKSPSQDFIGKVDRRDKLMRIIEVFMLLVIVLFNVFFGLRLQSVINKNNQTATDSRKTNAQRQNEIQDYIKCVVLIRFDDPPLPATATREETSKALDECAKKTGTQP